MRIFGSNSEIGDWMLDPFVEKDHDKISEVPSEISKSDLVEARSEMERCKESGEKFYFGERTSESVKRDLNEYAEAIGMPREMVEEVSMDRVAKSKMARELTVEEPVKEDSTQPIFDIISQPSTDPGAFKKNDSWKSAESSKARSLSDRPSGEGIAAVRGGEEYEADPVKRVKPGENSIDDPDAIGSLSSSTEKTNADLIRESNAAKRKEAVFDVEEWQAAKKAEMDGASIIPDAGKRRVESPYSQNHSPNGPWNQSIMSNPDSDPMPDKTAGEQIVNENEQRKASISREVQDDEWENMESSVSSKVSDIFYDSLKKELGKSQDS
jgi:hypothetical protein